MMLHDTIESIPGEPIDDIFNDYNQDFGHIGPTFPRELNTGDKMEVFWPIQARYYPGIVSNYDEATGKHVIHYDDCDHETLDMRDEVWRPLQANQVKISKTSTIHSEAIKMHHETFGHK